MLAVDAISFEGVDPSVQKSFLYELVAACNRLVALGGKDSPAVHLLRARCCRALGLRGQATLDLKLALRYGQEPVRLAAAKCLLLDQTPPTWDEIVEAVVRDHASAEAPKITRAVSAWIKHLDGLGRDPLQVTVADIASYMQQHSGRELAVSMLLQIYEMAAIAGYVNLIPAVRAQLDQQGLL